MKKIINNKEVFEKIAEMLLFNNFNIYHQERKFKRESTGCEFSFEFIGKYTSVLDFQLDFPFYSIIE